MTDSDRDPRTEVLSSVVLSGYRGDPQRARAHLDDPDPRVRAAALGALARLDALDGAQLTGGLEDPDATVRRRAARIAAGRPEMVAPLLAALRDGDPMVAEVAAFALGEVLVPSASTDAVIDALSAMADGHTDPLCREAAVAALGSLGAPAGLAAVLSACRDRAPIRRRAVLALAAFEGPEVSAMLRDLCGDRDLQVRQAAEDLLAIEQGESI